MTHNFGRQDSRLLKLKNLVDAHNLSARREELITAFAAVAHASPQTACGLMMRAIERIIKDKQSPGPEIRCLFAFITASENTAPLTDILGANLPPKYAKLQYFLKVYTLRSLIISKAECNLDVPVLLAVAGGRDAGKFAVIDYIITRPRPTAAMVRLLQQITTTVNDKVVLGPTTKRGSAIQKLLAHGALPQREIVTHKDILAHWDTLVVQGTPEFWRKWLKSQFRHESFSVSERRALSSTLINVGNALKHSVIVIELWSAAIELEAQLPTPTKHIFDKVWRLLLAAHTYPQTSWSDAAVVGLQLCLEAVGGSDAEAIEESHISQFAGVASALHKPRFDWSTLTNAILTKSVYGPALTWLLLTLAASAPVPPCQDSVTLLLDKWYWAFSETKRLELELSYCAAYNECYSQAGLERMTQETTPKGPWKSSIAAAILAKVASRDVFQSYKWCQRITDVSHAAVKQVMLEQGFVNLADRLGLLAIQSPSLPQLHEIKRNCGPYASKIETLDSLTSAWFVLWRAGCYQDAMKYIRAAIDGSQRVLGADSVRRSAYLLLSQLSPQLNGNSDDNGVTTTGETLDGELKACAAQLADQWLGIYRADSNKFAEFDSQFKVLQNLLDSDPLWTLFNDSAAAMPAAVSASRPEQSTIQTQYMMTLAAIPKSLPDNWALSMEFSRKVKWLQLLNGYVATQQWTVQPQDHEFSRTLASRSFHSQAKLSHMPCSTKTQLPNTALAKTALLDTPVILLDLEFDDKDTLQVSRRTSPTDTPTTIRLPISRMEDIFDEAKTSAMNRRQAVSYIDGIIEQSTNVSTTDSQEFWQAQNQLDQQLQHYLANLQKHWFGGFVPFLTAHSAALCCSPDLVREVEAVITEYFSDARSRHRQYRRNRRSPNHNWTLSPLFCALLQHAVQQGTLEEIEDVVAAITDAMKFQGIFVASNESSIHQMVQDLKLLFNSFAAPATTSTTTATSTATTAAPATAPPSAVNIVLICDRKAAQIPWEVFPLFKDHKVNAVTRSLSLRQVEEWLALPQQSQLHRAFYLVNPSNDLPETHKVFAHNFAARNNWHGHCGSAPTTIDIAREIKLSRSYIYVGHGSGRNSVHSSSELRDQYECTPATFLLGCNSVRVRHELADNDALSDFMVLGSPLIMGALWSVKDKDFNRFSLEFLSRVFDDHEPVGEALKSSRGACVLPYLTAGAPVVYALPHHRL